MGFPGRIVLALFASLLCGLVAAPVPVSAAGGGPTGVVFYFRAGDPPPPSSYEQEVTETMFNPGHPPGGFTVENYFLTQTFGSVDFSGDGGSVFGPYEVATSSGCPFNTWNAEAAGKATAQDGFNRSDYSQVIYIFVHEGPANPCSSSGIGGGEMAWVNNLEPFTIAHELGHVLGSPHAAAYRCLGPGHVPVAYSGECAEVRPPGEEFSEYGDPFDPMGSGRPLSPPVEMSAWRKFELGAIPPADTATIARNGTYTIVPLEQSSGVRLLRIPNGAGEFLDLDFRQRIGFFDETYPADDPAVHGVAIHLDPAGWGIGVRPSRLLDTNPETGTFGDAPLAPGRQFHDFRSPLTIETIAAGIGGATVKISGLAEPIVATALKAKTVGCRVPKLEGKKLRAARKALDKRNCGLRKVKRRHSRKVPKGKVIAQKPRAGKGLKEGGKVTVVISAGPSRQRSRSTRSTAA
ncbi:MAG TPA: PASTA domain-containing protein [Solirubrobacterales bacterium]|jgi:hypothetical protein|nr:PASTA domain-containing protein [Solirubrobacterales bacterium]